MLNGRVITFIRFRNGDELLTELEAVAEYWRTKPGNISVELVRSVDEPSLMALIGRWENIGSYRRALGGQEGKLLLTPVLLHAVDEPTAYLPLGEAEAPLTF